MGFFFFFFLDEYDDEDDKSEDTGRWEGEISAQYSPKQCEWEKKTRQIGMKTQLSRE
jgi:hypothetical protein